ncbi:GntR family transcriptional regulator [Salinarimonas ramus]|uniref:GntR family transcriptional regulator n=1 Tax=Salinarimonas ramus TaxID=690164 RepID=A0A917V4V2_9HYPH|nr:GntR family transcriptional regulator [Salinarimonas ramus]GGK37945.1 GntR family transcriptional regulator [Salinarimonas ramus]
MIERGAAQDALGYRPLYRQVRDVLVKRISDGVWQAGAAIPSEPELAADLGVSQGTVRKALDAMAAERLVVRRQGRGTYVARHDDARILFQFFKLVPDDGPARFPTSRFLSVGSGRADAAEASRLSLARGARVTRLERVRALDGEVCVHERIVVEKARFADLEKRELPNNLYEMYATSYGVPVARAVERLKAMGAPAGIAAALGVAEGAPLLQVDRVATAIDGAPVEWRLSLCRTDRVHYASDLR